MNEEFIKFLFDALVDEELIHRDDTSLAYTSNHWNGQFWQLIQKSYEHPTVEFNSIWDVPEYKEAYKQYKKVLKSPFYKALS